MKVKMNFREISNIIVEYDTLQEKRSELLKQKVDLDDDIRKINQEIKILDFKFHQLQKKMNNDSSQEVHEDERNI